MKVGDRGQVTIPKPLRDQFDIRPGAAVEFHRRCPWPLMTTAINTNALLDILGPDPQFFEASVNALEQAAHAEVHAQFGVDQVADHQRNVTSS